MTTVLELRKYSKAASSSVEAQHLKVLNIKNSIANKKPGHYGTRVSLRIDAIPTEKSETISLFWKMLLSRRMKSWSPYST